MMKILKRLTVVCVCAAGFGCRSLPPVHHASVADAARARAMTGASQTERDATSGNEPMAGSLTNLTLTLCIEHAIQNNRALARKQSARERAVLGERIASTELLAPTLDVSLSGRDDSDSSSGSATLEGETPFGFALSPFLSFDHDDTDTGSTTTAYGITLSRPLFALHERMRQRLPLSRARRDLLVAEHDLLLEQRELRLRVTRAFYDVQRAIARLEVRRTRVVDSDEFLAVVRRRVDNGFSPPVDIVNATIDLKRAESAVAAESASVQNALDALKQVMGFELDVDINLGPLDTDDNIGFEYGLEDDLVKALTHHEKVLSKLCDIQIAEREILVERDAVRPQIDLELIVSQNAVGDAFFDDSVSDEGEAAVTISYSTELDFARAKRARLRRLENEQTERLLELKDIEIQLTRDLRAAARSIDRFQSQIKLDEARFTAEESRLQATIDRYEQGNVDNLEVTRAKRDVDNAALVLLDSRIGFFVAIARYQALLPDLTHR